MVIAVFRSLEGGSLEDYSIRLAEKWRIGQKGLDNGAILLVFVDDRKMRLEVGYGLEPVVPDIVAGRIIREVVAPRFRERRYAAGLGAAVDAVFERVDAGRGAPPAPRRADRDTGPWVLGLFALFAIVAFMLVREAWSGRRFVQRHGYTAGGRGWSTPAVAYPWWRSGGFGGGFGGGGSSGGGGFSGGGGSFGGGGASGDW